MNLRNNVAIITGASGEIGLATAHELLKANCHIIAKRAPLRTRKDLLGSPGPSRDRDLQGLGENPVKEWNMRQPLKRSDIAQAVRFMLEQPEHARIPKMMLRLAQGM